MLTDDQAGVEPCNRSIVVTLRERALQWFGVHLDCLTLQLKHDIVAHFCDVNLTMSVAL